MKTKEKANRFIGIIAENIEKGQTVKRKKLNRAFYGAIDNLPHGKLKAELQKNSDTYFKKLKCAISRPQVTKQPVQNGQPIERFPYNLFDRQGSINTDVIAEKKESLQRQIYASYISRKAHCLSSDSELYMLCTKSLEAKTDVPKWLHDFNVISCMTISNKSGRALQCIMERFHIIANEKVEESLKKKSFKSANAIKEGLVYFMVWCHFKFNEVEAFSKPSYEDLMASILSLYVDLVLHTSRNLDIKVRKLLGKELATRVGLLLHQHPSHILEVLLQLTMVEELDVDVIGPLYRKALEGSIDVTTCEQYVKYMATVAQYLNTFQSDDVSNALKLKALAIPAPGDLLDWIGQHQRSLLDMMPIERKFKGAAITRFLLDEGNEEIWASILDIIGENTQADMPKNDSMKAVADKGLPNVGEPVGDDLEETPLFYMDTSADPAVAVLMENEVNDVAGENGDGDLIIDEDADVIVEEDDDIRIEDDDEVTNEDDLKDQNMDTPALFELNKNLNSEKAHEKDDPDIIEELYVIDTAPTRITLSQSYAEMTPQTENQSVSDNEDVELIEREDVQRNIETTEEIYVVDTEKWSKKPESIVSQMNLPDTISPICTPPRSSRRARAGVTPKAINVGDSPKSSIGREMKATPKAIIDRAPATDQTRTPVRKSKPNPVETIEEINLDEIVSEDFSPKSSITQEMKFSLKTGIERRKSQPNPVEVVEEIDLVASDTETRAKYTKLKTPKPKPNEKGIAPISQSKKGKTTLVSPRRTRRTSQMQTEKAVDEITVVEETQPDMFESQDAQIVDNSTQDKDAESKEKKNENGADVTDVAILEIRQDRVSDTSDNEGNEATTFAIPDISKHLKKGPGENSIKGLKKGENSGVKRGRRKEDVASDTSEDTHISSIPNISQHLKTDETQAENSIDDEESTKSVRDKTPKLSKKTKTPRRSSRKSVVKTSPCCEEKKNEVITDVTLTRKNIAALQETDSDAATPMKQKRTKQRNVKLDDKFSPPLLRSRNSSGDSINASTKGTPQKSKSLKKSTGITVYDFHGSASELSDFGTPPKRKILSPISEVTQSLSKSGKKKIRTPKSKIPLEFETVKTSTSKTTKLKTPSSEEKLKLPASSRKQLSTPKQTVETLSKLKQAQKEAVSEKRPRRESANY